MTENIKNNIFIPILPLRDVVVYPNVLISLFIGREKSIRALELSYRLNKKIILLTQKKPNENYPNKENLFSVGTLSNIIQIFKLPDGTIKILIEGLERVFITKLFDKNNKYLKANYKKLDCYNENLNDNYNVMLKILIEKFETYIKLNKKINYDIFLSIKNIYDDNIKLIDNISYNIHTSLENKQHILEEKNINKRLEFLLKTIESEINLLKIEKKIKINVKKQIEKGQKEYYLNEQIKAIQKELKNSYNLEDEFENIKKKIISHRIPKNIEEKINNELYKLKMMSQTSAEAYVIRNYIDWLLLVPWYKKSKIQKNINISKNILDKKHYGLNEIKERILEYLSVNNRLNNKIKGPILCLVGPPGVGKTSLCKSIAESTGRKYEKISLGGIRDEAEIRGHRRTYIGSMPGKIIQKISKVKVKNPLILLDEIDKMSFIDYRGDPASALLEVLDIEQNNKFNDNYLEIDYDLSDVMFVATSNTLNIPSTLLDRMEIINISGYSELEKLNISKKYLIKKLINIHGLKDYEISISNSTILNIIRNYTKESGLRNLEREISKILRKVVKILSTNNKIKKVSINNNNIKKFLGAKKNYNTEIYSENRVGKSVGLAWTECGGDVLNIETVIVPGNGKLLYTGSLGNVIKESIKTSLTVVRYRYKYLKIDKYFYKNNDIHIHIPEGSTPKEGPSAGITICISIISFLTNNPVKSNLAMTGEITLHGNVLQIGGLKEKILAAKRYGIKNIIIPKSNINDFNQLDKNIKLNLNIYPVKSIEEVINISLENKII